MDTISKVTESDGEMNLKIVKNMVLLIAQPCC